MTNLTYTLDGEERLLCFYFCTRGFGYAIMNSAIEVVDKGMQWVSPVNNKVVMEKVKDLIDEWEPERIVIEDYTGKRTNKRKRIIELLRKTAVYARRKRISLSKYSRDQIQLVFNNWDAKTRFEIAKVICENIESYENFMFEKPRFPEAQHFRCCMFDAASLGVTHYYIAH